MPVFIMKSQNLMPISASVYNGRPKYEADILPLFIMEGQSLRTIFATVYDERSLLEPIRSNVYVEK